MIPAGKPSNPQSNLMNRVVGAAEAALADHSYVSLIDVLCGMGLLSPNAAAAWRKGRIEFLEPEIQGSGEKISSSIEMFWRWAIEKGLKPSETDYVRRAPTGTVTLRFTRSGDPDLEKIFRIHFISAGLSEQKQKRIQEKLQQAPELVVLQVLSDAKCSECGAEVGRDSFLLMEAGQPLCLACARLDDLEFLPSGDAALTRRSAKHSQRMAVVVRFSRSRKRNERQGILVETSALEKAERECADDAEERAAVRARDAELRREEYRVLAAQMAQQIRSLFPGCPPPEAARIAEHTARRGSGRIGRTKAGRGLEEQALTLAVAAAIRHDHTNYDELLASGLDREGARRKVGERVEEILSKWRR